MKKKILPLVTFLFCLFTTAKAQNTQYNIRDSVNYVFSALNTIDIPSGILYEKASPSLNWDIFTDVNDTTTSVNIWKGIYKVLRHGAFSQNTFLTDDSLNTLLAAAREDNVMPLLILNYKYDRLKPHVLDSNLLTVVNKQLFDVAGRTETPYTQHRIFNACSAFKVFYGSTARFVIDSAYYFSNYNAVIIKMETNWSDGLGYRTVNWGDTVSITYADENAKLVSSRIILAGGDTLSSSFYFKIVSDACDDEYPHDIIAKVTGLIPYPEGATYPTATTSAKYTLTYGFNASGVKHTCLQKPVLFVQGFDPGYQNYPTTFDDCKYGRLGWIDIIIGDKHDLEKGTIEPWDPEFLEGPEFFGKLMNDPDDAYPSVVDDGYDVIFLDFKDGTEYMQRNSYVLVEMINWINENKCSDEEIIIIGASMGGQLVRYVLTYMEKNNIPHCTKLSINFDSPAQGANVPYGLQGFVKFGYDVFPDLLSFIEPIEEAIQAFNFQMDMLQSPAARQLLIPHFEGDPSNNLIHDYRIEFYDELFALDADGYPNNVPTIAIANGNKTGTPQSDIEEGQLFLNFYYDFALLNIEAQSYFLPGHPIFGYEFKGSWELDLLIDIGFGYIFSAPTSTPNYDTAPGSQQSGLQETLTGDYSDLWIFSAFDVTADNVCFVPTISALDINTDDLNFDVKNNIDEDFPNPSYYPFQSYYSPNPFSASNNENHVQLSNTDIDAGNDGNINWAIDKMELYGYVLTSVIPVTISGTLENTYNYGNKYHKFLHSVNINSGGLLQINGNYNTDYGDGDPAVAGSTFTVTTSECNITTVNINSGGLLELGDDNTPTNNKGILELLDGSKVIVKNGGTLKLNKYSKLYIKSGATLEIRSGSTLKVEDFAQIIVENGGKLLMKAETLTLVSDNSQLIIQNGGTVETNTNIDLTFSGSGYITYNEGGVIDIGNGGSLYLNGSAINDKVLSIGNNAELIIEENEIEITNAQIDISPDAGFTSIGNTITTNNVKFLDAGTSADFALQCKENTLVKITYTTFSGFDRALVLRDIAISDVLCPADAIIEHCTFANQRGLGIDAEDVSRINCWINNVTALDASVAYGISAINVAEFKWRSGTLQGYSTGGIYLENVLAFMMHGGTITQNEIGIEAYNSNIFLRELAEISNNNYGIYMDAANNGVTDATTLCRLTAGDIGCAWIINNETAGIFGWDIMLDLDAIDHANASGNPLDIHRNRFDGNGIAINVCLENENDNIDEAIEEYYGAGLNMRENYWGSTGEPEEGTDYEINITADIHSGCDDPAATVDATTSATSAPADCACLYPLPCDEEEPSPEEIALRLSQTSCDALIPVQGNSQDSVMIAEQYRQAYMLFTEEDFNLSYQKFNYLKNAYESNYPQGINDAVCRYQYQSAKQLKLLAAVIAEAYCQYPFYPKEEMPQEQVLSFTIYPNPAENSVTFSASDEITYQYIVREITGRKISEGNRSGTVTIDISNYNKGIYLVEFHNMQTGGHFETQKLIIQ